MARVKLSSFLQSVSGSIGNIVYYSTKGREYARVYVKPANPDTEGQRIIRRTFGDAVRSWQILPPEEKQNYNRQARRLPISGYNLFISLYMKRNISHPDIKEVNPGCFKVSAGHPHGSQRAYTSVSSPFFIKDCSFSPSIHTLHGEGIG